MQSILLLTAFVTTLLNNASIDLWVGLTSDSKGHFQWAKPGLLSYTNWAPGEPLDNSGPHHNKTPVLKHTHLLAHMSRFCPRRLPVLRISLSPLRETVWWWFMGTHRRTLACGLPEPVRWKVMVTSVKGHKVWYWIITTTTHFKIAEYMLYKQKCVSLNHLVWLCCFFRLGTPSGPGSYSCHPFKACGAGWSDLPGCGEASGLDWCSSSLWITKWDPGKGEGSVPTGLSHSADQQPTPACLDLSLQLWSELIMSHTSKTLFSKLRGTAVNWNFAFSHVFRDGASHGSVKKMWHIQTGKMGSPIRWLDAVTWPLLGSGLCLPVMINWTLLSVRLVVCVCNVTAINIHEHVPQMHLDALHSTVVCTHIL